MSDTEIIFTDLAGYRKAYATARAEILEAHGLAADAKGVRLAPGLIVMDLQTAGGWMTYTDDMTTARDRVRINPQSTTPAAFRLRTRS